MPTPRRKPCKACGYILSIGQTRNHHTYCTTCKSKEYCRYCRERMSGTGYVCRKCIETLANIAQLHHDMKGVADHGKEERARRLPELIARAEKKMPLFQS